jgi:hypothetical protein
MKKLLIIAVILTACTHKETPAEKLEREYQKQIIENQKINDSIDLELIKLGVKP